MKAHLHTFVCYFVFLHVHNINVSC